MVKETTYKDIVIKICNKANKDVKCEASVHILLKEILEEMMQYYKEYN